MNAFYQTEERREGRSPILWLAFCIPLLGKSIACERAAAGLWLRAARMPANTSNESHTEGEIQGLTTQDSGSISCENWYEFNDSQNAPNWPIFIPGEHLLRILGAQGPTTQEFWCM